MEKLPDNLNNVNGMNIEKPYYKEQYMDIKKLANTTFLKKTKKEMNEKYPYLVNGIEDEINVNNFNNLKPEKHKKVEKNSEDDDGEIVAKESQPEEHREIELNGQNFMNTIKKFLKEKFLNEKSIDNDTLLEQLKAIDFDNEKNKKNKNKNKEKTSKLKKIFNKNLLSKYFKKFKQILDENIKKTEKNDMENLKQKIEILKKQNKDLENENESFKTYNKNLKSENMYFKNNYENLKNINKNLKENNKNLKKENENIENKNKDLKKNIEDELLKFNPSISISTSLQNKINKLKIEKLNEEISSLEEYIKLLKSENKIFSEQNSK